MSVDSIIDEVSGIITSDFMIVILAGANRTFLNNQQVSIDELLDAATEGDIVTILTNNRIYNFSVDSHKSQRFFHKLAFNELSNPIYLNNEDPASENLNDPAKNENLGADRFGNLQSVPAEFVAFPFAMSGSAPEPDRLEKIINKIIVQHYKSDATPSEVAIHICNKIRLEIHERTQQLVEIERAFYDGCILAGEQVQDKRLDLLEEGPEVTIEDIFIEIAIGFIFLQTSFIAPLILLGATKILKKVGKVAIKNQMKILKSIYTPKKIKELKKLGENFTHIRKVQISIQSVKPGRGLTTIGEEIAFTQKQEINNLLITREKELKLFAKQLSNLNKDAKKNFKVTEFLKNSNKNVKSFKDKDIDKITARLVNQDIKHSRKYKENEPLSPALSITTAIRRNALLYLHRREKNIKNTQNEADELMFEAMANPDNAFLMAGYLAQIAYGLDDIIEDFSIEIITDEATLHFEHIIWLYLLKPVPYTADPQPTFPIAVTRTESPIEEGSNIPSGILHYFIERFGVTHFPSIVKMKQEGSDWEDEFRKELLSNYEQLTEFSSKILDNNTRLMDFTNIVFTDESTDKTSTQDSPSDTEE